MTPPKTIRTFLGLGLLACCGATAGCSGGSHEPQPFVCNDAIGCVDIGPGEPIRIGVLQSLSGDTEPLGREQVRGIELALDRADLSGLGHPVVFQIEDTGCTAEGGANAALKVIADPQTVAILGTTCSGAAATAAKAMSEAGLTMISGNNSAPFLTAIGGKRAPNWQAGYFRTAPNEENAGRVAARYAFAGLGLRRAATVNDGDIYTQGLAEGFEQTFRQLGGQIVFSTSIEKEESDVGPTLNGARQAGAEILFFPLFQPDGNNILLGARGRRDFDGITLMSDGALIEASFLEAVGETGRGMLFVGPAKPEGPAVSELEAAYRARYGEAPSTHYYLNGHDAAGLLFSALNKLAVRDSDGTLHFGRQALRDTLYATRDFAGVTGSLSCDEFGDCARSPFNILRLDEPAKGLDGLLSNVMFSSSENDSP